MNGTTGGTQVFVGLGGNLGDAAGTLRKALQILETWALPGSFSASSLWETRPVGPVAQAHFVNAVAGLRTELSPEELLRRLLDLEQSFGRVRLLRWGPRTLDLDLLLYGETRLQAPFLTLPHPRLHQRGFVLAPLNELAPTLVHPVLGQTVASLWEAWKASVPDPDEQVRLLTQERSLR